MGSIYILPGVWVIYIYIAWGMGSIIYIAWGMGNIYILPGVWVV